MKLYPAVFVNHGGGPLPLLGRQPNITQHLKEAVSKWLPSELPKAIVVVSAHWESNPIQITSSPQPSMYFDYYNFPPQSYEYKYPAPGEPKLAAEIQKLLEQNGLKAELNDERGFDHGVFVPLMLMYPKADIPVVCVSLHSSLSPETHWKLGSALSSLREQGILILGSGYAFHNMKAFFNPSDETKRGSTQFNDWLKETLLHSPSSKSKLLLEWEKAPGARLAHPREEHLLPLLVVAGVGGDGPDAKATLIQDVPSDHDNHAISAYMFS